MKFCPCFGLPRPIDAGISRRANVAPALTVHKQIVLVAVAFSRTARVGEEAEIPRPVGAHRDEARLEEARERAAVFVWAVEGFAVAGEANPRAAVDGHGRHCGCEGEEREESEN